MRGTSWALALILVVFVPAVSAEEGFVEVQFLPPGQAGPEVSVFNATWALLVFDGNSTARFTVELPNAVEERNITVLGVGKQGGWIGSAPPMTYQASDVPQELAGFIATVEFSGPGSLYLEGAGIRVEGAQTYADLMLRPNADCLDSVLTNRQRWDYEARYDGLCPPRPGTYSLLNAEAGTIPFTVDAQALTVIEWHHAQVVCQGAAEGGCPDGGVRQDATVPVGGQTFSNQVFGFHRLTTTDARIEGEGGALRVVIGGPAFDLDVVGWVRLPLASGVACGNCLAVENQTLGLEGNPNLRGLRPGPNGTLLTGVGGDVAGVHFDEAAVEAGDFFGWPAALAVGAASLVAIKALAILFSRIAGPDGLLHQRRRRLLALIQSNPGINFSGLSDSTGWSLGVVRFHVQTLLRGGHIIRRDQGKSARLFENHGRYGPEWKALAILHEEPMRTLHSWLAARPGVSRADAVNHAGSEWHWSRRTTYHRLQRLAKAGLLLEDDSRELRALQVPKASEPGGTAS